ncbi:MAG: MMPL family transporter [Desulfurococcaceae archaeon]
MNLGKLIVKHSIIIIIIWIVLITVSTPAFFRLEEVTLYRAERLLPSGVESERAARELARITNRTGGSVTHEMILITGVNVSDPRLIDFDRELSNNIEKYVIDYNSVYKIAREVFRDIDRNLYNSTLTLYYSINQIIPFLDSMHRNGLIIINLLNNTHIFLIVLCRYYDNFNSTQIKEYAYQLYNNLSMIPFAYNYSSNLYKDTLTKLNNARRTLDYSINTISYNYTFTLFSVLRIHYYLLNNSVYQNSLNKTIIEELINYTRLSNYTVDEVLINKTYEYVVEKGFENISIDDLIELTIMLVKEYVEQQKQLQRDFMDKFLTTYSGLYNNIVFTKNWSLEYFLNVLRSDNVLGQIELLNELKNINNTIYPIAVKEFSRIASEITIRQYGFPVELIDVIEKYYLDEIDLYIASREITRVRIISLTGIRELSVLADIVYKHNGNYSYNAIYDLVYNMFQLIDLAHIVNIDISLTKISSEYVNLTRFYTVLSKLIADRIWSNRLDQDFVYRLLIGFPIIIFTTWFNDNPDLVNDILYNSILVNNIINENYRPGDYSPILSTMEMIIKNTDFNLINYLFNNTILFEKMLLNKSEITLIIIRRLFELPVNASTIDYINLIVETIMLVENRTILFPTKNIVDLIYKVINGMKPLDAIVYYLNKSIPPDIDFAVYTYYLNKSISMKDPLILYSFLRDHYLENLLNDLINRFINIMVSESLDAFIITVIPLGNSLNEKVDNLYRVLNIVNETLRRMGIEPNYVGVIGDNVLGYDMTVHTKRDMNRVQFISIIAPILIALVLITGFLATVVPFIGIATSLTVSTGLIYLLASMNIITVSSWSRVLLITTSFGLGMDYTSYIILRFKEKYPEIRDKRETVCEAIKYALPAIIAASSTDIVGFAVMKLAWEFPLIASIGETIPIAIIIVLLVSITFTPAILALFGDKKWFWWPHSIDKPIKRSWRGFELTPRRVYILLSITLVLVATGYIGFTQFRGSHDYSVFIPQNTISYKTYIEFQKYFPSGKFIPVYAVFILRENYSVYDEVVRKDLERIVLEISSRECVSNVYSFINPGDKDSKSFVSLDNKSMFIEIILNIPPLSREGVDTVSEIRKYLHSLKNDWINEILVGGLPASSSEIEEMLNNIFWTRVFPVAFILMWICMAVSFNSLMIGLIALITIITGYLMGISTVVYIANSLNQPVLWFLTLLTLPAVLGVGLDYNSFYVNRQRYELMNRNNSYEASSLAIKTVSHLVIGLGLIVTATYGSIITGSSWGLREIGIALSTSVFVTTILSSIVFTPAILALMNKKAWWPGSKRWSR